MKKPLFTAASSLPRMSTSFKVAQIPISRAQLEKRLQLLSKEEAHLLFCLEKLAWQSWFMPEEMTYVDINNLYREIVNADVPFIQQLAAWYLDLRSIFAALRMRRSQKEKPKNHELCFLSTRAVQLLQQWDKPDFGLQASYPWLPTISAYLEKNDTVEIEDFLLNHIWHYLSVQEQGHYFDIEYLAIYLLRWNIIDYWTKFNKNSAVEYFDALCSSLLEDVTLNTKEVNHGEE